MLIVSRQALIGKVRLHMDQVKRRSISAVLLLFNVLLCSLVIACQSQPLPVSPVDAEKIDRLLALVETRLAVAPLVAQAKWNSGAAIDDPMRESQILDAVS